MNLLLLGDECRIAEIREKIAVDEHTVGVNDLNFKKYDLIIDCNFDEHMAYLNDYITLPNTLVLLGTVKYQLAALLSDVPKNDVLCTIAGLNSLPTFLNRDLWELSVWNETSAADVAEKMAVLAIDYQIVQDRVGMVTPRVICMIINEACYTLQEGTASIDAINQAMKLGTRYPYGPFEWANKIGVKHVYETLAALYDDTKDERYKICPLLKTYYLNKTEEIK